MRWISFSDVDLIDLGTTLVAGGFAALLVHTGDAWSGKCIDVLQRCKHEQIDPYFLALSGVFFLVSAAFLKSLSPGASLLPALFMCSSLPFAMRSCFAWILA